jgi:hypothetical protein
MNHNNSTSLIITTNHNKCHRPHHVQKAIMLDFRRLEGIKSVDYYNYKVKILIMIIIIIINIKLKKRWNQSEIHFP